MEKLPLIKKWPHGDPPSQWILKDKRILEQFNRINAEFDKKFVDLMNEKINAINTIK